MKDYLKALLVTILITVTCAITIAFCNALHHPSEVASIKSATFTFDGLLDAIEWVESKGDPCAVGDNGNAVGAYQIHKIYVDDVNRIIQKDGVGHIKNLRFTYIDRTNKKKSRVMAWIYLNHYGGTFEEMGRKHNGGPQGHKKESTKAYWVKVKARMEDLKVRIK